MSSVEVFSVDGTVVDLATNAPVVVEVMSTGVQGPAGASDNIFVPSSVQSGQTDFILPIAPGQPDRVRMWVNGQRFGPPSIAVLGDTVTWAQPFTLSPTDTVEFTYPFEEA